MTRPLPIALFALLAVAPTADAVVIRDDREDAQYLVPASEFPALADMPGEGHGVLIAPQWVVTAAHTVTWQADLKAVVINGLARAVERLVLHPGHRRPSHDLIHHAQATGDATLVLVLVSSSDDIALLKLAEPVTDVAPATLYRGSDELGKIARIIGKGATGDGAAGYSDDASHRTELRSAFNTITSADGRWFCYVFDQAPTALPLEGASGSGDSGGPALIEVDDRWLLAGLTSWKLTQRKAGASRQGLYGEASCNLRIGQYVDWIESTIASQPGA